MSNSLNLSLTDELRRYVDERSGDSGVYATPSEYIRDLIRRDMQECSIALHVLDGLEDVKKGRFSPDSILDIMNEE
jgi:antitoxin ParD1/3/4